MIHRDFTDISKLVFCVYQVARLGMFEVSADELVRALAKRSNQLFDRLLNHMSRDHNELNMK